MNLKSITLVIENIRDFNRFNRIFTHEQNEQVVGVNRRAVEANQELQQSAETFIGTRISSIEVRVDQFDSAESLKYECDK